MQIYDLIIIGGGAAGYSAALYSARAGLKTLVIEGTAPGGQMGLTDIIENYPGFDEGVDGFTLGMKMQGGAEKYGAETLYATVSGVELKKSIKEVTADGIAYYAKAVVIATGASPRKLGIQGEDSLTGRGIHYCAHCDGRFYKDRDVIVVGGGNSAVSDAAYLSNLASRVYLVHRRDTFRAERINMKALEAARNVELVKSSELIRTVGDGKIEGAVIKDRKTGNEHTLKASGIFISIGRQPSTELFKSQIQLDENGYVVADETTKTAIPGVFAAGDVRTKELRQVVTAAADGAVAAHFAEEYILTEHK